MWIRKAIDVLVMTLLLLGPAVLLSKLETTAAPDRPPREVPTEVTDLSERTAVVGVEDWYF